MAARRLTDLNDRNTGPRTGRIGARARRVAASVCIALGTLTVGATAGCDAQPGQSSRPTHPVTGLPLEKVTIAGKEYKLELALNNETRFKGLSDRTKIEEDGGMLFVFPQPAVQSFVMRDCPIDIDIIFLDGAGRITATHAMKAEEPQREDESDLAYNDRLTKYPSRGKSQFVIELAGGTLAKMDPPLKRGELIKLDVKELKSLAKN
ncbi:MAG: DUF192 domain-containing protein [Phycisphaerales bacterium JB037]